MIAAGSLFTSCVTNTEPQGIKDIRQAKADYLESLSKLREANAEKVKAEAALVQAKAATEQARAALVQAAAKAKEIANDTTEAAFAIRLAKEQAAAEVYLAQQEKELAKAEEALRKYLLKIKEQSKELTGDEQRIVEAYTTAYNNVIAEQDTVRQKEKALYEATYNDYGMNNVEVAKAAYEQDKVLAEQSKAYFEAALANAKDLSDEEIADYSMWVKAYDALKEENASFQYDKAQIVKDSALNEYENKAVLDSFYAAIEAKNDAINKAKAPFKLEFTGKKVIELPHLDVTGTNVVTTFAENVNALTIPAGQWIHANTAKDTLGIKLSNQKVAEGAVDTLNIIIDALKREQVVVDQLVKDTAGIAALVATTKHEYDSIKTVLEAGIAKFDVIAEAEEAAKEAKKAKEKASEKFVADTTELFASFSNFVKVWNENSGSEITEALDYNDSVEVWNAIIRVAKAREAIFDTPKNGKDCFYYCKPSVDELGNVKPDTVAVKFSELEFKNIRQKDGKAIYGGWDKEGTLAYRDALEQVLSQFGMPSGYVSHIRMNDKSYITLIPITTAQFAGEQKYKALLYDTYRVNSQNKLWVDNKGEYIPSAVSEATKAYNDAVAAITTAKQNFYKGIYCTFWGIKYDETFTSRLNSDRTAFTNSADSLKIVYTEKTFTEPTVLPKFKGETGFFTPAEGKTPASIDFSKVELKASKALDVIAEQLGDNYLKPTKPVPSYTYTLYAQYLATVQFANDAKNYKENTAALKELATIVENVQAAYDAAAAAVESGSALADSLTVKLIGKPLKKIEATDYVVKGSQGVETFISKDGKGTFKLAGEQKELAEKWLTEYAKTYSELEAQKAEIDVTISDNDKLATIYSDYVDALAALDEYEGNDPDEVLKSVKGYWYGYDATWKDIFGIVHTYHVDGVLEKIQSNINSAAKAVKVAEGKLAKLEAGYDQKQIDIESAQDELEKAQAELKEAEVKLAAAEEAYKAVLEAHGITE